MKISDMKNLNLMPKDSNKRSLEEDEISAFRTLIDNQGDFSTISPEARQQLNKLKLVSSAENMPEGFLIDFSLNFLSMQGTWNFHNRRNGGMSSNPIPSEWKNISQLSLDKLLENARNIKKTKNKK